MYSDWRRWRRITDNGRGIPVDKVSKDGKSGLETVLTVFTLEVNLAAVVIKYRPVSTALAVVSLMHCRPSFMLKFTATALPMNKIMKEACL